MTKFWKPHMRDAMAFAEKEENRDRMIKDIPGLLREANFISLI